MIIEANGKFYTTTLHTEEKMLDKGISTEQVTKTIEEGSPDVTEKGDDIYRLKIRGRIIAVIIADDERIITVYPIE